MTKKEIPDDVVFVFVGIFCGVLFAWLQMPCVYTKTDFIIYIVVVSLTITLPMIWSGYVYYCNKKNK